jgi:hypothetical protein
MSSTPAELYTPRAASLVLQRGSRFVAASRRAFLALDEGRVLRRVRLVWWLLFFNVLGSGTSPVLHIPHRVGQVLTQGALLAAFVLALTVNPRARLRPNLYLGVFTVLGVTSLMSSIRFVSIGTDYRALRLLLFLSVMWLLTPWWGRRDMTLLRAQVGFLVIILGSVVLGLLVSPHGALDGGRLGGAIWPIAPPQVAHYSAELLGLSLLLWMCRLMERRVALMLAVSSFAVLILTHTRTALVAAALGFLVASISLFTLRRRVRRVLGALVLTVALVGVPLSPLIVSWLARGESAGQLASLTGRTNFWGYVFAEQRSETQTILGNGIGNGAINGQSFSGGVSGVNGLPIDNSWVEDYQDQGLAGDFLTGVMFIVLLVMAAFTRRGPRQALALFFVLYCLAASFTEDGAGIASQYAMDMTVAASLMVPELGARFLRRRREGTSIGA